MHEPPTVPHFLINRAMMDAETIAALRNSSKGQLYYNRNWAEEGKTKELLDQISVHINSLNISPKALSLITSPEIVVSLDDVKSPKSSKTPIVQSPTSILASKVKSPNDSFDDVTYIAKLSETELPLLEYENERQQAVQKLYEQKKKEYDQFSHALCQQLKIEYECVKNAKAFQSRSGTLDDDYQQCSQESAENDNVANQTATEVAQEFYDEEMRLNEQKLLEHELLSLQDHFIGTVAFQIRENLNSCECKKYLQTPLEVYVHSLRNIAKMISMAISTTTMLTRQTVTDVHALVNKSENLLKAVLLDIYNATIKSSQETQQSPTHKFSFVQTSVFKNTPSQQSAINEPPLPTSSIFQNTPPQPSTIYQPPSPPLSIFQNIPPQQSPIRQPSFSFTESLSKGPDLEKQVPENFRQGFVMESILPEVPIEVTRITNNDVHENDHLRAESPHAVDMEECDVHTGGIEDNENSIAKQEKQQVASHIDPTAVREYSECLETLEKLEKSLEPFATNPRYKKYKMELHKAVTTPINAISSCTGSHLRDKINRLVSLLSGQSVSCGGKYTSCRDDPLALTYCKKLIAEKIVMQGEEQVSSQFSTAFPYAAVIVSVCAKFPDVWPLVLGNFYRKCPYLVPYYPPQEAGQSDTDYYMSLGYRCVDGEIEEKDKFLKRMSGLMRLYTAILLTSSLPDLPSSPSHCTDHGWIWTTRILNMDPRPDVTPTLLFDLLEFLGHLFEKKYNKQFNKLLHVLCTDFFQKIKQVSPTGSGPISRLEIFLQSALKKRQIPEPEGRLPSNFWRT